MLACPSKVATTKSSFSSQIFLALSSGSAVLLVSDSVRRSPSDLAKVLFHREPVTVLQTTPTLFHRFQQREISTRILGEQSHVRVLAFGGERCPSLRELAKYKAKRVSQLLAILCVATHSPIVRHVHC